MAYKIVTTQRSQLKAELAMPHMADSIRVATAFGFGRGELSLAPVLPVQAEPRS